MEKIGLEGERRGDVNPEMLIHSFRNTEWSEWWQMPGVRKQQWGRSAETSMPQATAGHGGPPSQMPRDQVAKQHSVNPRRTHRTERG